MRLGPRSASTRVLAGLVLAVVSGAGRVEAQGTTLGAPTPQAACTPAPAGQVGDFGAPGPFPVRRVSNTGPDGRYSMFLPSELGAQGFRHPVLLWGNGMGTHPDLYAGLLEAFASHGFVVVASNAPRVDARAMTAGLTWVLARNAEPGDLEGRLAPACVVTVGHSLGGGAALGAARRPGVVATVSLHGVSGPVEDVQGALLILTATADGVVTPLDALALYERSRTRPTLMSVFGAPGIPPSFQGHLIAMGDGGPERAPAVAWLRLWVYGDEAARGYFFGEDCVLCRAPWTGIERGNADWR